MVNGQSHPLGSPVVDVSPALFATASFNAGVSEIAVVGFADAGSVFADTTITVIAPVTNPQAVVTSDYTPPTIVPPGQQLVVDVGSKPVLSSTYLQTTDSNSAHYTLLQLSYTITAALSHGYLLRGGSIELRSRRPT